MESDHIVHSMNKGDQATAKEIVVETQLDIAHNKVLGTR